MCVWQAGEGFVYLWRYGKWCCFGFGDGFHDEEVSGVFPDAREVGNGVVVMRKAGSFGVRQAFQSSLQTCHGEGDG